METVFLVLGTTTEVYRGQMIKDPDGTGAGWVQWKCDGYHVEKSVIHSIHCSSADAEGVVQKTPSLYSEERADLTDQESPVVLTLKTEYRVVQLCVGDVFGYPQG